VALSKSWAGFFARHTERRPNGVIAGLLDDWQATQTPSPPVAPGDADAGLQPSGNRDTPQRIAKMLADRIRRRRS
jgi:hypothetical protein